jgi:hypothetical protein
MTNGHAIGSLLIGYQEIMVILRHFVRFVAVAGKLDMRTLWAIARQETWLCSCSIFRSASKLDFQSTAESEMNNMEGSLVLFVSAHCAIMLWSLEWYVQSSKVKQSLYRSQQALRVLGSWGFQISRQSTLEGGEVVSPMPWPPVPPRDLPGTNFC